MKLLKKLGVSILAMLMIVLTAIPAMADSTGSITVKGAKADETYKAYKIFDVVYSGDLYNYTIASDSEWLTVVQGYEGITLTRNTSGSYNASTNDDFSASVFAELLSGEMAGKTSVTLTYDADTQTASATGLDLGYYLVDTTLGALCNLTTTTPTAEINDKNDVPFDKTDDKESVDGGEVVTYNITGKVPETVGFSKYTYKITDTMSTGLTFNQSSVEVKVAGAALAQDKYTLTTSETGFVLNIDVMGLSSQVGAEIKVTYTADVNINAAAKIEKNKATLEYSNNPTTDTTSILEDEETVYSAKVVIDKYAEGDKTNKLSGAKFVLYKENEDNTKSYYKLDNGKVTWVAEDLADVVTTVDGVAAFEGLKDGTYKLHETKSPDGYNLLTSDVTVTINGADATVSDISSLTITSEIANATGPKLPTTGGMGTTIIYIAGAALVVISAVLFAIKRKVTK